MVCHDPQLRDWDEVEVFFILLIIILDIVISSVDSTLYDHPFNIILSHTLLSLITTIIQDLDPICSLLNLQVPLPPSLCYFKINGTGVSQIPRFSFFYTIIIFVNKHNSLI